MPNQFYPSPDSNPHANPYAPPTMAQPTMSPPNPVGLRGGQNVFRDGKRIVVLGPNFSFPACCIKTGRIDELVPQEQTLKFVKNSMAWALMFGAIGAVIAQSLFGQTLQLKLPVNAAWLGNKKRHFWIGLWIALGGGALFVLGLFAVMMADPSDGNGDMMAILPLLGMLVGLGGLIYMAIAGSINLLTVHKMDGQITWLDGASPEFLATLPDWSTMGPISAPGVLRRS